MRRRRFPLGEVREVEPRWLPRLDSLQALLPALEVDVGWRRRRQHVAGTDPNAGGVAHIGGAVAGVEVADVVHGVARGIGDLEATSLDRHGLAAAQRPERSNRHRQELAPQPVHVGAVEPRRAGQQLLGTGQVPGAQVVDVHGHARHPSDNRPRRAGVVEMDVREQQRPDVAELVIERRQSAFECREARGRSGIHQDDAAADGNHRRRDDAGPSLELQIDGRGHAASRRSGLVHRGGVTASTSAARDNCQLPSASAKVAATSRSIALGHAAAFERQLADALDRRGRAVGGDDHR